MTNQPDRSEGNTHAVDFSDVARVGLIGDVHTEDGLLDRAIQDLRLHGAELILCVGDIASGTGDLARCCDLLQRHDVLAVRGNHDRWLIADVSKDLSDPQVRKRLPEGIVSHLVNLRRNTGEPTIAYLAALPATRTMVTRRGIALLCHGLGSNDTAYVNPDDDSCALEANMELRALLQEPDIQIVLNGHTHRQMVRHLEGLTIVNAGTLHRHQGPGAVLLDLLSGDVSWLDFSKGLRTETAPLGTLLAHITSRSQHA